MSGGVDSSMCAHILQSQGYDVTGLYMHNWNHQEETQDELESRPAHQRPSGSIGADTLYLKESTSSATLSSPSTESSNSSKPRTARIRPKVCTSDRDWADVQAVCAQIGIPARRLDFSRQYWNQVFEVMLQEYERGRTPNPDVACNREIKFGELIEWCNKNGGLGKDRHMKRTGLDSINTDNSFGDCMLGWDYLATGHYAKVEQDPNTGQARLLRAQDSNKDQTYYLSTLSERVLRHVLFPLAQYDKPTVKKMALMTKNEQLQNAATKKESMGICFVGQRRRFGDFLKEYLDPRPGPVRVDAIDGQIIGQHNGLFQYTIGQASGISHRHQKWVVLRTDLPSNTLVVVEGTQNERLLSSGLIAESWHWIAGHPPKKLLQFLQSGRNLGSLDNFPFTAQVRHRQVPQLCNVEPIPSGVSDVTSTQLFRVRFKDPQRAIAAGQQLVLYDQDECLGGAVIQSGFK
ncbi:hypothetical protein BG011_005255 [Mortierella polycephala]|uniref:tRNA-5-taurinomethyluridine 2-sulfurtransferase n=1 Tax=Mortierella polycephala TaxID=41804 RepID=A0A9P6QGU8_9FUNG|nr:hypothetical protein BG011_005255 [Mortierella polycephala]